MPLAILRRSLCTYVNTYLIIIYNYYYYIIKLAIRVYCYYLKILRFCQLGNIIKILIKLIYSNLKTKINI